MTTITTIVGMFPLALGLGQGGEFLQPLGIIVFFRVSISNPTDFVYYSTSIYLFSNTNIFSAIAFRN